MWELVEDCPPDHQLAWRRQCWSLLCWVSAVLAWRRQCWVCCRVCCRVCWVSVVRQRDLVLGASLGLVTVSRCRGGELLVDQGDPEAAEEESFSSFLRAREEAF